MNQEKIGKFIASKRKEKNLTQIQLAEKLGVTDRSVSKWENGRCMPDLSLFEPLCEELDITINELLSGEELNDEEYRERLEKNIIDTIDYTDKKFSDKHIAIGIVLLAVGFLITLSAISTFPSESSWNAIYSLSGIIIALIGFSKFTKYISHIKRILLSLGFLVLFSAILLSLDFINVKFNNQPPRFSYNTQTMDNTVAYQTPFYNVFRINANTENEYYIMDSKKEYTIETVPTSPFNITESGIDNIIKYKNKYVGNNSNDGNLINSLPLSEYGYVFEIDSENCGLTIDYHITDWYIKENLYLQKCVLYNSAAIFSLIENAQYITYNFTGNSYQIQRETFESNYPNYKDIINNGELSKENFSKYVENKMNNEKFIVDTFGFCFVK